MRKSGYYWVKFFAKPLMAAYYSSSISRWLIIGDSIAYTDSEFEQIDEKEIIREKTM